MARLQQCPSFCAAHFTYLGYISCQWGQKYTNRERLESVPSVSLEKIFFFWKIWLVPASKFSLTVKAENFDEIFCYHKRIVYEKNCIMKEK